MTRLIHFFSLLCFCITATAQQPGEHVFAADRKALAANKQKIQAKDPVIMPAFNQLLNDAKKALAFGPVSVMEKTNIPPSGDKHDYMSLAPYFWPDPTKADGLPYIRKDGQTTPEVKEYKDKEYLPALCEQVHVLSLAYYFSGDPKYAGHATRLLRVWFLDTATRMNPNLNFGQAVKGVNTGRGAGLIDTRHFVKLIDAIGLLESSPTWTSADQAGMKKWFSDFLHWMETSKNGTDEMKAANNHGVWYDAQRLAMALFTGNREAALKIIANAQKRLDEQMDANGNFPKEMERTTSLHYSTFVVTAFFTIAQMAEKTEMNCWNLTTPSGKSLRKAFEILRPYLVKEKKWEGPQIKDFDFGEGYFLLREGAKHFDCKGCMNNIKKLAGDEYEKLRLQLLYE